MMSLKNVFLFAAAVSVATFSLIVRAEGEAKFSSSNPSVALVDSTGHLTVVHPGTTEISATDSSGKTMQVYTVNIEVPRNSPADDSQCPAEYAQICQMVCQMYPTLPICPSGN